MNRFWLVVPIVALTLVACTDSLDRKHINPVVSPTAPTDGIAPPAAPIAQISPATGWHVRGRVQVLPTPPEGSPAFEIEVTAPVPELARPDGGPNLIWHIGVGRCEANDQGIIVAWDDIFYRLTPPVNSPGRQVFTMPLIPGWATFEWQGRPLLLAAYVNGGGPLVACANLPS
jgi:hypothetical protein